MSAQEGATENQGNLKFFDSYEDFSKQVKESSIDYYPNVTDDQIKSIYDTLLKLQGEGVEFTLMEMSSAIQNLLWQLQNNHALSLKENLMPNYNAPLTKKKAETADQTSTSDQHSANKEIKTVLKKHTHSFKWPLPYDMMAEEYMLIMGVAASEGEFKSGDIFTGDNLEYAAGAMSTAAMFGASTINTDHIHEELPKEYKELYGLEGSGTHGAILDAAVETNKVVDGDGKTRELKQVEWIGYTTDPKVYALIKDGKYIGCSVEDYSRKQHCDCGQTKCNCTIEGSHFLNLALILKEVPDSHGTWVRAVTADDLAQWKKAGEQDQHIAESKEHAKLSQKMNWHFANIKMYAKHKKNSLDEYMDMETGVFHDGKNGIQEYLIEEVGISETDAKDIAEYLAANPKALNVVQMEYMSAADFVAWFRHKQNAALHFIMQKHLTQLKKDEVSYMENATENQCKGCRWYGEGKCNLVEGDIADSATCSRFEATPGQQQESDEQRKTQTNHAAPKPKERKAPTALIEDKPIDLEDVSKHEMSKIDVQELADRLKKYSAIGTKRVNIHEFNSMKKIAVSALEYAAQLKKH